MYLPVGYYFLQDNLVFKTVYTEYILIKSGTTNEKYFEEDG
jgi:hypothetical protein